MAQTIKNRCSSQLLSFIFCFLILISPAFCANVTYDHRSLIIDGQRKLFISASIHYPRSVPAVITSPSLLSTSLANSDDLSWFRACCSVQMWPGLVAAAKEGGCNTIETYVFWNGHELSPDNVMKLMLISKPLGIFTLFLKLLFFSFFFLFIDFSTILRTDSI